ncbi:lipoyl domain-containing protein [Candidatus Bipolaricaulota bacterium]|nr:lipoyl domain-containing protein [Candidatus Bipolaricaulota bacterium]
MSTHNNHIDVKVPELGKVEEVSFIEWKVSPGDEVTEGMEIAEIETMKSTFTVDAPADGQIDKLCTEPGNKVEIGEVLATINPY